MTVRAGDDGEIVLEGDCPAEDAEALLGRLLMQPGAAVDWRLCDRAHTAVVQVLLAAGAELRGPPRGALLHQFVHPSLVRGG